MKRKSSSYARIVMIFLSVIIVLSMILTFIPWGR